MKVHFCCGDIYLKGYINIDIHGYVLSKTGTTAMSDLNKFDILDLSKGNPNETTLDKYFKYPFGTPPRPFVVDKVANILNRWPFEDKSLDEVVMVSCIEHFHPKEELPHILKEINRTVKVGGRLIVDWPNIIEQVIKYNEVDPEFMMELIYCNHKNKYSIHHWGFTDKTFPNYLGKNWSYEFGEVVKHDYPMQGCIAKKES